MPDFSPPFATNGELRAPTTDEQSLGFPCGPASQALFNYMFNLMQGQVKNLADEAGVSSASPGDQTVVKRAVLELIDAATGGNPAGYMLTAQYLARSPVYPEILNVDGRIEVTSPTTGSVRVPGGVDFLHRGFGFHTTVQEDFSTSASKTYHLRWNDDDGFSLNDLADTDYNPDVLAETDASFDSTYDDMLVARVVTNSSNVATITNLANRNKLLGQLSDTGAISNPYQNGAGRTASLTWGWSRTPILSVSPRLIQTGSSAEVQNFPGSVLHDHDMTISPTTVTRYGASVSLVRDYCHQFDILASFWA